MATAIVCAYSPVGREALAGLLEAGIQVLALYTYPQGADEAWFIPPADLAGSMASRSTWNPVSTRTTCTAGSRNCGRTSSSVSISAK